jgi:hypothetical protein
MTTDELNRLSYKNEFWLAWLIDVLASHTDSRQVLLLETSRGALIPYFVDHGHILGGPNGDSRASFLALRYFDRRAYHNFALHQVIKSERIIKDLNLDKIWNVAKSVSEEWMTPSALRSLSNCFNDFANSELVHCVLQSMLENVERDQRGELYHSSLQREVSRVLRFGDR